MEIRPAKAKLQVLHVMSELKKGLRRLNAVVILASGCLLVEFCFTLSRKHILILEI